jgi:retron-type reverse transcriptase
MVRYADDFVICIQYKDEAERILRALKKRLMKFNPELAEDKTRIIEFGRFARTNAKKRGVLPFNDKDGIQMDKSSEPEA